MKPLSPKMLDTLMHCHEQELLKQEPFGGTKITQNTRGLIERGLLKAAMHVHKETGKSYMAFFITRKGKAYLEKL